jgi:hypothetical protein
MQKSKIIKTLAAVVLAAAVGPFGLAAASANATTVVDDFSHGTNAGTVVVGGKLQLNSPLDETFDALPAGWTATPWQAGGGATVSGGNVSVDAARFDSGVPAGPGSVLDFKAVFSAQEFQHVGFAKDFNAAPWAMFSTGGGTTLPVGLYARTSDGTTTPRDTAIPGVDPTQPHDYKIVWTSTSFDYYVDGTLVDSAPITIAAPMTPQISDFDTGTPVTVDSMKLTTSPGTYTSSVLDGGSGFITGITLNATADVPSGTTVAYETRTGTTSTPDASWSPWQPVGPDGAVASPSQRYLQYQAVLTTNDASTTPTLNSVTVDFAVDTQGPNSSVTDVSVNGTTAVAKFTSDDAQATYQCSLDGGPFATCTSPATFSGLTPGTHTFAVRGTDTHGNVGNVTSRQFAIAASTSTGGPGTPPPPAGGTTVTTPRDTVAPKLVITPKSVRLSKAGWATLKVKCPTGEKRCKVTMRLKLSGRVIAKTTVTILGGTTKKVSLKVSLWARAKLAKRGSLKVTASGTATDAAGNVRTTSTHITLKRALTRH